jgi:hypothetical protein
LEKRDERPHARCLPRHRNVYSTDSAGAVVKYEAAPRVHTGEQVAVPALPNGLGAMVATTFSVMVSAFAAPALRSRAHPAAAIAMLSFDFMSSPL